MARQIQGAVGVNNINRAIMDSLGLYAHEIRDQIDIIEEQIAKEAVKRLKVAGTFKSNRSTKGYRKGWRAKKEPGRGWIVHNATNYQLTHLLENGHALPNGGRSKAYPHIRPVEQQIIYDFANEIRKVVG